MRLPDLAGFRIEKLLEEDSFGWNYLAGNSGPEKRLVRILKSQATYDPLLTGIYKRIAGIQDDSAIPKVEIFSPRMVGMPATVSSHFPGWKKRDGQWELSSLSYLARILDQEDSIATIKRIVASLASLHQQGVYHGSLRPTNLFLTGRDDADPEVKISGFGEMVIPGLQMVEASDLPFYLAPEQFVDLEFAYDRAAHWDVYSFGVIAFQLLTKHLPRLDRLYDQHLHRPDQLDRLLLVSMAEMTNNSEQIRVHLEAERSIAWPAATDDPEESAIRGVIEKCLAFDPTDRFGNMFEVSEALGQALKSVWAEPVVQAPVATPKTDPISTVSESPAAQAQGPAATVSTAEAKPIETRAAVTQKTETENPGLKERNKTSDSEKPSIIGFRDQHWLVRTAAAMLMIAIITLSMMTLIYRHQLGKSQQTTDEVLKKMAAEAAKKESKFKQEIALKEKSSEELKENLDVVEDDKARLMGEATLARRLLRKTQESGDQFFRLVLENYDTDVPSFREERKKALADAKKHYLRLIQIYGAAPDFTESTAHAYYYLGRIYKEMGEYGSAVQSFSEAERRYLELTQHSSGNPLFTRNLAVAKQSIGELAMKNNRFTTASQILDSSSKHWQELRQIDPTAEPEAVIKVNLNSLRIIECHHALGSDKIALQGAETICKHFLKLQEKYPEDERIIGGLAASFELLGKIYESKSEAAKAIDAFQQGSNLFANAIEKNSSVDAYHLGLGNCLGRTGLLKNDVDKLKSCTKVLSRVISRNPHEPTYLATLADVYGFLSGNQRDGGKITNAISLEIEAIELLKPILENNKAIPDHVQYAYAKRLIHLADLRGDANKFDESRPPLTEAIDVLSNLVESETTQPIYRRTLAKARGLAGFASLKTGDKTSAKKLYEMAQSDWKNLHGDQSGR